MAPSARTAEGTVSGQADLKSKHPPRKSNLECCLRLIAAQRFRRTASPLDEAEVVDASTDELIAVHRASTRLWIQPEKRFRRGSG